MPTNRNSKLTNLVKFNRRDFMRIILLATASTVITACKKVVGFTPKTETSTQTISFTPSSTFTPKPSETPTAKATLKPGFKTRSLEAISYAVIHHSAGARAPTKADLLAKAEQFEVQHKIKSWAESYRTGGEYRFYYIAYHWLIANDGSTLQVQDHKYIRPNSGNNKINDTSIAICLIGDFRTVEEKKEDNSQEFPELIPTEKQLKAAGQIVSKFNASQETTLIIKSHREVNLSAVRTSCPGDNIGDSTDPQSNLNQIARFAKK